MRFKKHIRPETRAEVKKLLAEYEIHDEGGLHWLSIFADADNLERNCQDVVNLEGLQQTDRFGQKKSHTLLTTIRDARSQKMLALKNLCLDVEPTKDRPGRLSWPG